MPDIETLITEPAVLDSTGRAAIEELRNIRAAILYRQNRDGATVYGFHVDGAESDPAAAVTYLEDAVGLTPAAMNFSTGVFSYGSWANAFFMPRPCMLKYDGTVDYYLDPNDFTKKTDGTASDIADASYGGNAMMEWGDGISKIYMKVVGDNGDPTSGSVYLADRKIDDDYHCWPFVNNQGVEVMHFYTPIYGGSIDSNGKLRSLSGKTLAQSQTMTEQSTAARANNPGDSVLWDIENLAERMLINALLILMGKSLNTQAVFGNGRQGQASSATSLLTTGTLNDKGLFWGASDDTHDVKVFGMSWWGNQWHRVNGYLLVNGVMKAKMTHGRQDGTTVDDYNETGSGYISLGSLGTYSGAFQEAMTFNSLGYFPRSAGGSSASSTTFWCDPIWTNTSGTKAALFGGSADNAAGSPGAFGVALYNGPALAYWIIGAAPSCKPLAP